MPAGRPAKPGSKSIWIPEEIVLLVEALKEGDRDTAAITFCRWYLDASAQEKPSGNGVDTPNKPDVN